MNKEQFRLEGLEIVQLRRKGTSARGISQQDLDRLNELLAKRGRMPEIYPICAPNPSRRPRNSYEGALLALSDRITVLEDKLAAILNPQPVVIPQQTSAPVKQPKPPSAPKQIYPRYTLGYYMPIAASLVMGKYRAECAHYLFALDFALTEMYADKHSLAVYPKLQKIRENADLQKVYYIAEADPYTAFPMDEFIGEAKGPFMVVRRIQACFEQWGVTDQTAFFTFAYCPDYIVEIANARLGKISCPYIPFKDVRNEYFPLGIWYERYSRLEYMSHSELLEPVHTWYYDNPLNHFTKDL